MRRWSAGNELQVDGFCYRVVAGYKSAEDLRLELFINDEWRAVPMSMGMIMADFFCENEDVLYPYPARGGGYYLGQITLARYKGWRVAYDKLQLERANRSARTPGLSRQSRT